MANPILDHMNNRQMNQPLNNYQGLFQFAKEMQGKNPEAMIQELLTTGQMSQQQFQELKKKAIDLEAILK